MLDKGYHDYDYTEPTPKRVATEEDNKLMSPDALASLLSTAIIPGRQKSMSDAERIQRDILEDKKLRDKE